MFLLNRNQYEKIKPFFKNINGCLVFIADMEMKETANKIFVDDLHNPTSSYINCILPIHYLGGKFSISFLNKIMNYIITTVLPVQKDNKITFFFASDEEWQKAIEEKLSQYNGRYLTSLLYQFNKESYIKFKQNSNLFPQEYEFKYINNKAIAIFQNQEVCRCSEGLKGLGIIDLDVFTHEQHRRKGLAQIVCMMMIDYCIENNYTPQWQTSSINVGSCKLAEKLGFENPLKTKVNVAVF